jgi:hypothetical protein
MEAVISFLFVAYYVMKYGPGICQKVFSCLPSDRTPQNYILGVFVFWAAHAATRGKDVICCLFAVTILLWEVLSHRKAVAKIKAVAQDVVEMLTTAAVVMAPLFFAYATLVQTATLFDYTTIGWCSVQILTTLASTIGELEDQVVVAILFAVESIAKSPLTATTLSKALSFANWVAVVSAFIVREMSTRKHVIYYAMAFAPFAQLVTVITHISMRALLRRYIVERPGPAAFLRTMHIVRQRIAYFAAEAAQNAVMFGLAWVAAVTADQWHRHNLAVTLASPAYPSESSEPVAAGLAFTGGLAVLTASTLALLAASHLGVLTRGSRCRLAAPVLLGALGTLCVGAWLLYLSPIGANCPPHEYAFAAAFGVPAWGPDVSGALWVALALVAFLAPLLLGSHYTFVRPLSISILGSAIAAAIAEASITLGSWAIPGAQAHGLCVSSSAASGAPTTASLSEGLSLVVKKARALREVT